jgi:hypothetical protein
VQLKMFPDLKVERRFEPQDFTVGSIAAHGQTEILRDGWRTPGPELVPRLFVEMTKSGMGRRGMYELGRPGAPTGWPVSGGEGTSRALKILGGARVRQSGRPACAHRDPALCSVGQT